LFIKLICEFNILLHLLHLFIFLVFLELSNLFIILSVKSFII